MVITKQLQGKIIEPIATVGSFQGIQQVQPSSKAELGGVVYFPNLIQ